jgi:hypothetical protein
LLHQYDGAGFITTEVLTLELILLQFRKIEIPEEKKHPKIW